MKQKTNPIDNLIDDVIVDQLTNHNLDTVILINFLQSKGLIDFDEFTLFKQAYLVEWIKKSYPGLID